VLVTLEGVDGVGKSTQARLLAARLRDTGRDVVECREPGGTELGERIRSLLLDHGAWRVGARAEALLFAAARAQLVEEVIRPALDAGAWVVCDRFYDSSVAYQGEARSLGAAVILETSLFATGGLRPDRTLLLVGPDRATGTRDRIESEDAAFRCALADAFTRIAASAPSRVTTISTNAPISIVAERVWQAVGA
jgi:dTMP kinase